MNIFDTAKVTLLCAGLILMPACHSGNAKESQASDAAAERSKAPKRDPMEIVTPDTLRQQLKVGKPKRLQVADTLEVAGRVEADATRLARVGSPVTGRITALHAIEGEQVQQGQRLATVYSTELSDIEFGFIKAYSQQKLFEQSAERAKQLLSADVIGRAELQRREAEVLQAGAEVASLRQQLHNLGMSDEAIDKLQTTRRLTSEYTINASIAGTLLERRVTIGQIVQPAEEAFLVADLSTVWLVADIPEQDAGAVTLGKQVEANLPAYPKEKIRGRLSFVSATVNPETRTVRARMTVPNPRGHYKPAMLTTMKLTGASHEEETVPSTAVVREDNQDYVFVQVKQNTFALRSVTLGAEYGDHRVLVDGVAEGEVLVTDGAFHLNNERKRLQLQGDA